MSGHSKWANIHRKKEANDKVKGSIFTKMAKGISIAVKKGGGIADPEMNYVLRLAIDKAKSVNMPKENIDRAISKGKSKEGESELIELMIEGFGPNGLVVIVEAVTDNRNRTVAEIRTLMEKGGGRMGEMGTVSYMFEKRNQQYYPLYPIQDSNNDSINTFLKVIKEHDDVVEVYDNLEKLV